MPTRSRAPARNPESSLRWTLASLRATASTTGRSHPVRRGNRGSSGVMAIDPPPDVTRRQRSSAVFPMESRASIGCWQRLGSATAEAGRPHGDGRRARHGRQSSRRGVSRRETPPNKAVTACRRVAHGGGSHAAARWHLSARRSSAARDGRVAAEGVRRTQIVVSPLGFEPRTKGLKVPCSTTELRARRKRTRVPASATGTRLGTTLTYPRRCPMIDDPASAAPSSRPGLFRSLAHRLAGDQQVLPVEGRLASFDGADGLAELGAADAGRPARARRPRRLLDLHVRQLAAHRSRTCGLGREVRRRRPDHRRRAHARVRLRARPATTSPRSRAASASGSRSRSTATTACGAPSRTTSGRRSTSPMPRGGSGYHHFGEGEYAETEMVIQQLLLDAGATGPRPGPRDGGPAGPGSRRRLADAPVARDVHSGTARRAASRQGRRALRRASPLHRARIGCRSTTWDLTGEWTVARHAASRTSRATGSPSSSTPAT